MTYREKAREVWSKSPEARKAQAYYAERAGYPSTAAARYILGTGSAPWRPYDKITGAVATATGA
jgi:hypothetical protein